MKKTISAIIFILTALNLFAVDISVDTGNSLSAISPLIYGTNQDMEGPERVTLRRFGGNRTTGYNWETNYSHAGEDWYNVNDWWLCTGWYGLSDSECSVAGALPAAFHADSLTMGADSLITIQMAGYVAADQAGTVTLAETAPSSRWHEVVYEKGSAFQYPPDTSDNYVYMDEFVDYLYDTFGGAAAQDGIKYYSLDNEPALWDNTHPRIHPTPVYCSELVSESTALAKAIKNVDPGCEIFSPVLFGFSAYEKLDDQDWASVQGTHEWFISWFLEQMASAETTEGMRLIDYLDIHYYSEAREGENFTYNDEGVERVTSSGCTGPECETARMHAPRMLWDDSYTENSWLGEWCMWAFPLLPKLQESIDTYYPGTKLAFTEWAFGGGNNYSGGIAYADTLGIFGKYGVDAATMWKTDYGPYHSAAFRLFRNYDGAGSAYGSTKVYCESNDTAAMPVYASIEGGDDTKVHIIALNRSGAQQTANINIAGPHAYTHAEAWAFDDTSPDITARTAPVMSSNSFSYTIPAGSAFHFFIQTGPGSPTRTRTITQTHTVTPTRTNTPHHSTTATLTVTMTVTGTPPTNTHTPTLTPTLTCTPTGTPSVTFSVTKTATLTQTPTFSFTATYSYTFIPTFTATISFTVTKTQTVPATFSETQTPNATATFTATPVYSPVPTAESGELTVEDPFIYPNPYNPEIGKKLKISFHINKPARNIRLKIYTMAKRMVRNYIWREDKTPGKHVVKLDGKYIGSLSSGVYAYLILAEGNDGKISRASAGVLIILR